MEPLIRVLMLGSFPPQSQGVQDYCREIGESLSRRCQVRALGFRRMYPHFLFPGVKSAFDRTKAPMRGPCLRVTHRLNWYNPLGWLWAACFTPTDVFHAQWWSLPLWPVYYVFLRVMKLRRKPIVLTIHNVLPHEGRDKFVRATRILCRMANQIIVHSAQNRQQLLRHYGLSGESVARVPLGVYMPSTPQVPRESACRALNLEPRRRYVLSFGIIRAYKGIDVLIRAFTAIAKKYPNVDLIIAGKPWVPWEPYQALIARHGIEDRVHRFLDYIPEEEIRLHFGAADIVALPYTHFDAQSGVGAVALPYKKPLIVSSVGSLPEWVGQNKAWIVPPKDPAALARRLDAFFTHPEQETAAFEAVAEEVLAAHSWSGIAAEHHRIYKALLRQA